MVENKSTPPSSSNNHHSLLAATTPPMDAATDDPNVGHSPQAQRRQNLNFELIVRQQPKQARMCGVGGKADRRPIDPPPIVQLRVTTPNDNSGGLPPLASGSSDKEASAFLQNPYYFMFASLAAPDSDEELHLLKDGKTRYTTGSVVSSLYHLKDQENGGKDAGFFVFPDLSVRTEGSYRLKLSLFEVVGAQVYHCKSIFSKPFYVYTAKKFPGMEESTQLSCSLADQGIKIRIRKDIRVRKRPVQVQEILPIPLDDEPNSPPQPLPPPPQHHQRTDSVTGGTKRARDATSTSSNASVLSPDQSDGKKSGRDPKRARMDTATPAIETPVQVPVTIPPPAAGAAPNSYPPQPPAQQYHQGPPAAGPPPGAEGAPYPPAAASGYQQPYQGSSPYAPQQQYGDYRAQGPPSAAAHPPPAHPQYSHPHYPAQPAPPQQYPQSYGQPAAGPPPGPQAAQPQAVPPPPYQQGWAPGPGQQSGHAPHAAPQQQYSSASYPARGQYEYEQQAPPQQQAAYPPAQPGYPPYGAPPAAAPTNGTYPPASPSAAPVYRERHTSGSSVNAPGLERQNSGNGSAYERPTTGSRPPTSGQQPPVYGNWQQQQGQPPQQPAADSYVRGGARPHAPHTPQGSDASPPPPPTGSAASGGQYGYYNAPPPAQPYSAPYPPQQQAPAQQQGQYYSGYYAQQQQQQQQPPQAYEERRTGSGADGAKITLPPLRSDSQAAYYAPSYPSPKQPAQYPHGQQYAYNQQGQGQYQGAQYPSGRGGPPAPPGNGKKNPLSIGNIISDEG